jgi:hypothetical protein
MRTLISMIALLLAGTSVAAEQQSLLLYINPHEYSRESYLGMKPYFSKWVTTGPAAMAAARKTLGPLFKSIDVCEGNKAADVIATISPQLYYNPVPDRYYAKVKVRFYTGDGKLLNSFSASGYRTAPINSAFSDTDAQKAFEDAMHDIATQYGADNALQQSLQQAMQSDFTHMPCEMVGMIPGK